MGGTVLMGSTLSGAQARRIASMAAAAVVDEWAAPSSAPSAALQAFLKFPEALARVLPRATVRFRLRAWLRDGCESVESDLRTRAARLGTLPPTLFVCSQDDLLLPSRAEGERLLPLLRARCGGRAELIRLPGAGHAPLSDPRLDLAKLIRESTVGAGAKKPVDYVGSYEAPTLQQVEEGSEGVEGLASTFSPVFLSTSGDGTRSFGLDGVPDPSELGRPVLLVGNHQLLALDLGPLVREFLVEKGFTPRGLAHPTNFPELFPAARRGSRWWGDAAGLPFELRAAARASLEVARGFLEPEGGDGREGQGKGKGGGRGKGKGRGRGGAGAGPADAGGLFGGNFRQWGAVPVTPRNFIKLLQQGEAVLLFPGGAAEALSRPRDKYKLQWPDKTDFVRAAAKYDAVVVPFGGVGSADNLQDLPENWGPLETVRSLLPMGLGGRFTEAEAETAKSTMERWSPDGIGSAESSRMQLRLPEALPQTKLSTQASAGLGDRFYFSFGRPFDLKDLDPQDADGCARTYSDLRASVEGEIDWLLRARTKDPYRDVLRRQVYERIANAGGGGPPRRIKAGPNKGGIIRSYGQRAPSFKLEGVA
ncbi:unnamed protein product [Prorocentrum cordatum]|uniref:Acyltransferase n=1 Tax=Prorocentrum cordatum TaxID=2364126 RepID=A0ABN9TPS3_9DINO|nr:unnamed protein product [Polarella glacialis]